MEIFKIQLPLSSNEPRPAALVYNEDRSIQFMLSIEEDVVGAMRGRPKAYFFGEQMDDSGYALIDLGREAPTQSW